MLPLHSSANGDARTATASPHADANALPEALGLDELDTLDGAVRDVSSTPMAFKRGRSEDNGAPVPKRRCEPDAAAPQSQHDTAESTMIERSVQSSESQSHCDRGPRGGARAPPMSARPAVEIGRLR